MLIYVYAVLGTQLFFNLKHQVVVTNKMNFHTFLSSVTALMRLSTGERWNLVMHECMVQVITEHRPIFSPAYYAVYELVAYYYSLEPHCPHHCRVY